MPKAIADASTSSETAPVRRRASKRKAPLPANVVSLQAYRRRIAAVTSIDAEEWAAKAEGDVCPAWEDCYPDSGPAASFSWDVVNDLVRLGGQA